MVEIVTVEKSEYIRELRERAKLFREAASKHAANFLGAESPFCDHLRNKAIVCEMIAEVVEKDVTG